MWAKSLFDNNIYREVSFYQQKSNFSYFNKSSNIYIFYIYISCFIPGLVIRVKSVLSSVIAFLEATVIGS